MKKKRPHFFKVMYADFKTSMKLPRCFVSDFYNDEMPKVLTLIPRSGESFKVSVDKRSRDWYLGPEWAIFVRLEKLELGQFLHFFSINRSTLRVLIFNTDSCSSKNIEEPSSDHEEEEAEAVINRSMGPSVGQQSAEVAPVAGGEFIFQIKVKPTTKYQFYVPREIARPTGLEKMRDIVIQDPQGRRWAVNVFVSKTENVLLTSTKDFFNANKLMSGDTLELCFLIQTLHTDSGRGSIDQQGD